MRARELGDDDLPQSCGRRLRRRAIHANDRDVVVPVDDDAWDPAIQEDMALRLRAERVCIPGAAHSPAVEAPETTASTLTHFWNAAECRRR